MKKTLKRFPALILAVLFALMMPMSAFALTDTASETYTTATSSSTSTVVVHTGVPINSLSLYKIINVSINSKGELAYSFTDNFKTFQASDAGSAYKDLTVNDYLAYESSSDEVNELIGNYTAYAKANNIFGDYGIELGDTETVVDIGQVVVTKNEQEDFEFDDVGLGLYAVVSGGSSNATLIYQNVTATVVPSVVDGEYVIYDEYEVDMKTSEPTITKTVSSNSSMMGGIVRYKLTITIPTFPEGATNKTFFVKDNMLSTGLTHPGFTGLAEVKCDDTNLNSSDPDFPVKASYSGSTVYFDIDYDSVKDYKTITIQYDAYINENAVAGEANTNTAELIYSNSPFVGTTYDPTGDEERPDDNTPGYGVKTDSTDVYTYGVVIHKTDAETGDALEGAVFGIYRDADCTRNAINCATMVDGLEENTITTDENGYAAYVGLAEGTYYLKEISAPAGYTLSDEVTEIKVNAENSTSYYTATTTVTYGSSNNYFAAGWQANDAKGNFLYLDDSGNVTTTNTGKPAYVESIGETTVTSATESTAGAGKFLTIEVTNTAGKSLPGTGGIGVVPFIAVGSVLMIGAVVVLVTRKRMRDVEQG